MRKVAACVPTTRKSDTWTASLPEFLTETDSVAFVAPRRPEKISSSGVTSSGSRIFSTRGAGKAASTLAATLGAGFVAQPQTTTPKSNVLQVDALGDMADLGIRLSLVATNGQNKLALPCDASRPAPRPEYSSSVVPVREKAVVVRENTAKPIKRDRPKQIHGDSENHHDLE